MKVKMGSLQSGAANDFLTTGLGSAPAFVSTDPIRDATSISVSTDLVLNLIENVIVRAGSLNILRLDDNRIVESIPANGANVSGSGISTITINPAANLT